MKMITILRRWNNPNIQIQVTDQSIELTMTLDDFILALADEVAEPLVRQVVQDAGSPLLLLTNAQLEKRLVTTIESEKAHAIFIEATTEIIEAVKAETRKLQ